MKANAGIAERLAAGRFDGRVAASFLFVLIFVLSVLGCGGVDTIWSTQLRSPDGRWLAIAETVENSGFGAGSLENQRRSEVDQRLGISREHPGARSRSVLRIQND